MLCRFPGGNSEHPAEVDWVLNTTLVCHADRRVESLHHWHLNDTPVTMSRNRAIKEALRHGIDIVLMVDSDMGPDQVDPSKSFWLRALEFMARRWHEAPTVIAAPYCGPPPHENIYIFRWRKYQSDHPGPDYRLDQFTREEAAERKGIEAVAALPTGLIAIDMRIFSGFEVGGQVIKLPLPWFYYEWKDAEQTEKASTEDVTFTRDVSILFGAHGLETVFVDWDCWALHFKTKGVGKPQTINPGSLARLFKERVAEQEAAQAGATAASPAVFDLQSGQLPENGHKAQDGDRPAENLAPYLIRE
jgi:hypothetical protein